MAAIHSDEFKRDAVRIALTSGLTRRQVASDLGIGLSTLGKWVRAVSEEAKVPAQDAELLRENERLRKENRILREEREVLKKAAMFFAAWCADPQPSVPPDGGVRTRTSCLEAPAPVVSPAARHGAPRPYPRSAPPEPGQLRSTTDDRGAERAGHSCRTAACRAAYAPEWHPGHPQPQVQAHH